MDFIRTNRILSALPDNVVDWNKVNRFADEMILNDRNTGHYGFPPILGYFSQIDDEDIGECFNPEFSDTNYEEIVITKEHIGLEIFRVTDGHHRFFASLKAGIYGLDCELDESGFVYIQK